MFTNFITNLMKIILDDCSYKINKKSGYGKIFMKLF